MIDCMTRRGLKFVIATIEVLGATAVFMSWLFWTIGGEAPRNFIYFNF